MRVNDFLALVLERTEQRLPAALRHFTARIRFVWLQIHYWTPRVHYEVWLTRKTGRIEIGLHFEGPREFSYRWAEVMAPRMPEVQALLGPQMELEEWTPQWTRIHQTVAYEPLSETLAAKVAEKLAATIAVLQPMLEEASKEVPQELAMAAPMLPQGSRLSRRRYRRRRS